VNKHVTRTLSRRSHGRGFTLVEALVALLALSVGLLGVAGLQLTGLRANRSASWRSQATYLSYDILDRMRANRNNRLAYAIAFGAAPGCTNTSSVADCDLNAWVNSLTVTMPAGKGKIAFGADDTNITITIQWNDSPKDTVPLEFEMRSKI
jgi:type IV pilus assembly protein PilV